MTASNPMSPRTREEQAARIEELEKVCMLFSTFAGAYTNAFERHLITNQTELDATGALAGDAYKLRLLAASTLRKAESLGGNK